MLYYTPYKGEIMATKSPGTNLETSNERVVAFFRVQQDAFRAISALKEAGFTSSEIGLMSKVKGSAIDDDVKPTTADAAIEHVNLGGDHHDDGEHSESMWEKLKHFFGGDSSENADYRESAAGMRWDEHHEDRYYRGLEEGGAIVTVAGPRLEEAREVLQDAGAELQEEQFEHVQQNFSERGEGLDSAGDDIEEIDSEGLDAEDVDPEAARRHRDYRIQLHGEAFRSFRNRLDSRGDEEGAQSFREEPRLDELETSDDAILEDNRNKLRKPAA
jgi:hypothetical protein